MLLILCEASLWVVLKSENYKESIIGAVNLGGDTDTIGAITGSMTGIIYGYDDIPKDWLKELARREYLEELSRKFEEKIILVENSFLTIFLLWNFKNLL